LAVFTAKFLLQLTFVITKSGILGFITQREGVNVMKSENASRAMNLEIRARKRQWVFAIVSQRKNSGLFTNPPSLGSRYLLEAKNVRDRENHQNAPKPETPHAI
jgi:hypothetical protein